MSATKHLTALLNNVEHECAALRARVAELEAALMTIYAGSQECNEPGFCPHCIAGEILGYPPINLEP